MSSKIGPRSIRRHLQTVGRLGFKTNVQGAVGIRSDAGYSHEELQQRLGITRPVDELRRCDECGELVALERAPSGRLLITGAWDRSGKQTFKACSLEAGITVGRWRCNYKPS
jgi:hypothetical protein